MKIGFVGLGNMGAAMAANLMKAGHDVTVWNRCPAKADALVAAGATLAATPAQAAQGEVVMTMLADDAAVEAVVFGDGGILGAPALHVGHSTISVALAERLAAAQPGAYLSAPVFGRPMAAEAAKLFVVTAGEAALIDRCEPLFAAIGQRLFRVGEAPAAANLVKLCGNFLIMSTVEGMAEAMTLAEKGGVERSALLDVLTSTIFGAPVFQIYGDILVNDRFEPAGFPAPLGLKDMGLVAAAAQGARVPMPVLGVVRDHLLSVIAQGGGEKDWASIATVVRGNAGIG